ncbi:MAG: hypothetical protein Wins2KO_15380 [Winogradskyella sp.]
MNKVLAIIPARGGSKGIPLKNLTMVNGKPLIDWTINAALQAKCINDIVITSDNDDILSHAKTFKDVVCIQRPRNLAEDDTPTEPVIEHALLSVVIEDYSVVVLLQPTSPLRQPEDIDAAYSKFINSNATALISVMKPQKHPLKSFKVSEEGYLDGLVNNEFPFMARQKLPQVYYPNGAIYMIYVDTFMTNKTLLTNKTIPFEMSDYNSIDVDTIDDIKTIESLPKK